MVKTMPDSFLAFDLGAGSGRAMLGQLAGDKLALKELHRFPNKMLKTRGSLHWDTARLFENILQGLACCSALEGLNLHSIGIDTWGVDFALLSADDSLLDFPHTYRDDRTEGAVEEVLKLISPGKLYELTGCQMLRINTIFQLFAIVRDRSTQLDAARNLLFIR